MVKAFQINLSQIVNDDQLRLDEKFANFAINQMWNVFEVDNKPMVKLKDILQPSYSVFKYRDNVEYKGIPTGKEYFDTDGQIINYQSVNSENHPGRLKYKVEKGDILISSLKGAKVPAILIEKDLNDTIFSNGFYIFKVNDKYQEKFLLYILRSKEFRRVLDEYIYRGIGISAYRKKDFLNRKIPLVLKSRQENAVLEINRTEKEIEKLKKQVCSQKEIIDKIFANKFGFDLKELENAKKEKVIFASLNNFANNKDLRFDYRFHSTVGEVALKMLSKFTRKKIYDYLAEPIKLGASISPMFYDDDSGKAYYLTMATIKNWQFETKEAIKVKSVYWGKEKKINNIRRNDIVMARSGEGTIGKVAIIKNNENKAIFCDFTMRIRLKDYNSLFAYFYFRTEPFQMLIECNKKGLGNNTNIFPSQIRNFPLPEVSKIQQEKIVAEINSKIESQKVKLKTIRSKRRKIEKLVENLLTIK